MRWRYRAGPTFHNSIGIVELNGRRAEVTIFRSEAGEDADALQPLHTRVLADGPRAEPRRLDRRPEPEQPAAERHRAQRKPAPAQGEAADDVGQPVQVEEHTAARHRDREADRDPRPGRPC